MSIQDFKPNDFSMLITKVSFSFFFNSILKSPANIMVMVLRPSSGTIEQSSENFGANVPKLMRTNLLQSSMGVLERYKVTIKTFSPFTIHSAAHIASYRGSVFLVETSVLLPANDVEAFACAFIYCKCMLVISKKFLLAQI
jgi:hypothetical protein